MSSVERKALFILNILSSLAHDGHLKMWGKEYLALLQEIIELYNKNNVTNREIQYLIKKTDEIDEQISQLSITTSVTFLLSLTMYLCEDFSIYSTGERKRSWEKLIEYCMDHELIRHTDKKMDYHEVLRAEPLFNIIHSFVKKIN